VLSFGLAALMIGVAATPANATIVRRDHYERSGTFTSNECGFPALVERHISGDIMVRAGNNENESVYLFSDHYAFREVDTNPANGKSIVLRAQGDVHQIKADHVEGTIYEVTIHQSGQQLTVEDATGTVVLRDVGTIEYQALVDTQGDDDPRSILLDMTLVRISGPHPGFYQFDICPLLAS
jgi:hypothetical protein